MRMWRNWQTRRFQVPVGDHAGSSPVIRTIYTGYCIKYGNIPYIFCRLDNYSSIFTFFTPIGVFFGVLIGAKMVAVFMKNLRFWSYVILHIAVG